MEETNTSAGSQIKQHDLVDSLEPQLLPQNGANEVTNKLFEVESKEFLINEVNAEVEKCMKDGLEGYIGLMESLLMTNQPLKDSEIKEYHSRNLQVIKDAWDHSFLGLSTIPNSSLKSDIQQLIEKGKSLLENKINKQLHETYFRKHEVQQDKIIKLVKDFTISALLSHDEKVEAMLSHEINCQDITQSYKKVEEETTRDFRRFLASHGLEKEGIWEHELKFGIQERLSTVLEERKTTVPVPKNNEIQLNPNETSLADTVPQVVKLAPQPPASSLKPSRGRLQDIAEFHRQDYEIASQKEQLVSKIPLKATDTNNKSGPTVTDQLSQQQPTKPPAFQSKTSTQVPKTTTNKQAHPTSKSHSIKPTITTPKYSLNVSPGHKGTSSKTELRVHQFLPNVSNGFATLNKPLVPPKQRPQAQPEPVKTPPTIQIRDPPTVQIRDPPTIQPPNNYKEVEENERKLEVIQKEKETPSMKQRIALFSRDTSSGETKLPKNGQQQQEQGLLPSKALPNKQGSKEPPPVKLPSNPATLSVSNKSISKIQQPSTVRPTPSSSVSAHVSAPPQPPVKVSDKPRVPPRALTPLKPVQPTTHWTGNRNVNDPLLSGKSMPTLVAQVPSRKPSVATKSSNLLTPRTFPTMSHAQSLSKLNTLSKHPVGVQVKPVQLKDESPEKVSNRQWQSVRKSVPSNPSAKVQDKSPPNYKYNITREKSSLSNGTTSTNPQTDANNNNKPLKPELPTRPISPTSPVLKAKTPFLPVKPDLKKRTIMNIGIYCDQTSFKISTYSTEVQSKPPSENLKQLEDVPPEIHFSKGTTMIGKEAQRYVSSKNHFNVFKLMTSPRSSYPDSIPFNGPNSTLGADDIAADFLKRVLTSLENKNGIVIKKIVVTTPVSLSSEIKEYIRNAFRLAGHADVQVLPTWLTGAVALLDNSKNQALSIIESQPAHVLVFYIQNDGFFLSIVEITRTQIKVIKSYASEDASECQSVLFRQAHLNVVKGQNVSNQSKEFICEIYKNAVEHVLTANGNTRSRLVISEAHPAAIEEILRKIIGYGISKKLKAPNGPLLGASMVASAELISELRSMQIND